MRSVAAGTHLKSNELIESLKIGPEKKEMWVFKLSSLQAQAKKKVVQCASTLPPGSQAYNELPAVNIVLAAIQALSATAKSPIFGLHGLSHLSPAPIKDLTVQGAKQSVALETPKGGKQHPKHLKKKTEKALYVENRKSSKAQASQAATCDSPKIEWLSTPINEVGKGIRLKSPFLSAEAVESDSDSTLSEGVVEHDDRSDSGNAAVGFKHGPKAKPSDPVYV
ncbi:hypothetical protein BYT27DRAFT_7208727 [Phlegmacium glaucopus]|nr:hypothetical protein BYT27DRAFT_7208727 [Phlegmacium glaucopus]